MDGDRCAIEQAPFFMGLVFDSKYSHMFDDEITLIDKWAPRLVFTVDSARMIGKKLNQGRTLFVSNFE